MPSDDRDPKFERALAQHLRGGSAQANCPDAETLAAYHERNLSLEEMAQWKQHISACEACQETLALVETTENQLVEDWEKQEIPVLEAASLQGAQAGNVARRSAKATASTAPQAAATPVEIRRRRRPTLLRWAIPLGAVAAGVLVFIGVYEQRAPKVSHYADTEVAQNQTPAAVSPKMGVPEPKVESRADRVTSNLTTDLDAKRVPAEEARREARRTIPRGQSAKDDVLLQDAARGKKQESAGRVSGALLAGPSKTPSPANIPAQNSTVAILSEAPAVTAASPAAPAPPSPSNSVGGAAGGQRMRDEAKSSAPAAKERATVDRQSAAANFETNAIMRKQGAISESVEVNGADIGLILTPDNKVFWKLQPAGTLQLTTDGGKDWKSLETGANAYLTTGFAPSSRVCWIAGRAGTLLLTKDRGGHWTRISTPIAGDLGGVRASDAKHASIWDATHRISYATSDRGATWKQTANE
jgi:hypothetical protein